jgi:hypothetical protein
MHDQVTLQTVNWPTGRGAHSRARSELDRRWRDLLSQEMQYRSPARQTAVAG